MRSKLQITLAREAAIRIDCAAGLVSALRSRPSMAAAAAARCRLGRGHGRRPQGLARKHLTLAVL